MADWPITYEELEPYYTQAEWEMGISGQRVNSPFVAPMSKDYPVPPVPLKASGALFKMGAAKLGLDGRARPARDHDEAVHGARGVRELRHVLGLRLPRQRQIELRGHDAAVRREDRQLRDPAYGLCPRDLGRHQRQGDRRRVFRRRQKREMFQKAKAVVLSANGIGDAAPAAALEVGAVPGRPGELERHCRQVPDVGGGAGASGLFEHPLNEYKGVVTGAGIVDFVPSDPKRGFYGGGRMTARGYDTPINYGLRGLQPGAPRWGALYKKALMEEANHKMTVTCFVTQLPLETNRVDLDPDVKDDWGLPAMRITSTSHPDDIKNMEFFRQKSVEILEAAGATKVWARPVNDSRGGAHNRGTCRMGNDPKTSVVNKFHRAHDVPNLFIVDGSNLVTGGRNHPTMTIQALAFRAAEHLIREARRGTLRSGA